MAIGVVGLAGSWLWKQHWTILSTLISSLLLLVPISYPYFVMLRSPEVSAEAIWLQDQHDNLLWLGGDVYANAEFGQRAWKSNVYLIDTSRQLSVLNIPSWSPWEIGLDRCEDLLTWLGYSNAFCQFVKKGWSMAILGASMMFLSSLQRNGKLVFHRAGAALALLVVSSVVSAIIGWSLPFLAGRHIRSAADLSSDRKYALSLIELERAVQALPVLAQDTYYIVQRGVLENRLGMQSEYVNLRHANSSESVGQYDQAFVIFEGLVRSDNAAIRREALRGIMRFAIQDYNCGRFERSSERFRLLLMHQPCNVKAIYLSQLQGLRESRPETVYAMRDWMYEASERLNFGTKKVLRAVVQQHAAIAAGMEDDPAAIWAAQDRAKRP